MFREMVSSEAVVRLNEKTLKMAQFDERERPLVQQIFGSNPEVMAEAARIIEERFHPDAIDINMGCPVYNLVSNFNGASLIKEPERASAIIKAMKAAVSVPVSVKTRLGWTKDTDCLEFVKVIEDAGADLISMHGRTKEQGYSGIANWRRIGEARAQVPRTPFLVNGDIVSLENAKRALEESSADGVLIGRGMLGNPWFAQQLTQGLRSVSTDGTSIDQSIEPTSIPLTELVATIHEHARLQVFHYGERGLVKLRKHLPWYFKTNNVDQLVNVDLKNLRSKLVRISTVQELDEMLSELA